MTATTSTRAPRRGFTLVELLVAMALIIFIMVILTEAFTAGTGVFRTLKSQGDMQERLRAATSLLRNDLVQTPAQTHFGPLDPPALSGLSALTPPGKPLQAGYFYVQQPSGSLIEGADGFGVNSLRMQTAAGTPALAFTLRKTGIQPTDYFTARIPGSAQYPNTLPDFTATEQLLFNVQPIDYQQPWPRTAAPAKLSGLLLSQWAEVGWFLVPTGKTAGTVNPQLPLYSLRRHMRVVLNDPTTAGPALNAGNARIPAPPASNLWSARYAEVSCGQDKSAPGALYFNTPADLVSPATSQAAPGAPVVPGHVMPTTAGFVQFADQTWQEGQSDWSGDDIVLTDVISFNVRVLAHNPTTDVYSTDFLDLNSPQLNLPVPGFYDTGSFYGPNATAPVPAYVITGLEITLRVWDVKTSLARQVTMIVDM